MSSVAHPTEWSPVDGSKAMVTQMVLVKLIGSQNKKVSSVGKWFAEMLTKVE